MFKAILLSLLLASTNLLYSQSFPYDVKLDSFSIQGLVGAQSYSYGQHNGKWLIIGGRLDGLHLRQPNASFDIAGHNNQLIVIDPISKQQWTVGLTSLSVNLQEQLRATNAQFYQDGDYLYIVGGYGYSAAAGDHKTFEFMTAIDVSGLINAIVNNTSIISFFTQISDARFAVTGGQLGKVYDTFYLVAGQKFTGRYNPMGGATYTQVYTNQIRKMKISYNGTTLTVTHLPYITDAANLHRRDFNVAPQIMPNGEQGLTSFSGVFQVGADLPYLYCTNIDSNGQAANSNFSQYYNHYECPNLAVYNESENVMSTVFFGGIAQYYDVNGTLTMDSQVPFVKTIARVSRDANGLMTEHKLPNDMPSLLGASSHLIHNEDLAYYDNGVLKMDSLSSDTTVVGYIYGGIASTAANIFMVNNGSQSSASTTIYRVLLIKNPTAAIHQVNDQSQSSLQLQLYPNPNDGIFKMSFVLQKEGPVHYRIYDNSGKLLKEGVNNFPVGKSVLSVVMGAKSVDGLYLIVFEAEGKTQTQKMILK